MKMLSIFYHGDHLGSTNWITDRHGAPVQYIHYAPFGELIEDQCNGYDAQFKFTGKERDAETGYDYFGARFFWSAFSHWLSVDPFSDKYPGISPYAYCGWNPIKYVDPDGREKHIFLENSQSYAAKNFKDDSGIYIFGHGYPTPNGFILNQQNSKLEHMQVQDLATHITNNSSQWKIDIENGDASMIFLYACYAGEGDDNIAQQLSSLLNNHETFVIGPIGVLESSADPRYPQNGQYEGVKDNRGKESAWGVYKNGKLEATIRGNRVPTKTTVRCQLFFDNLWKSIKSFFNHENE